MGAAALVVCLCAAAAAQGERLLFSEDFEGDLGNWDVTHIEPERSEGRLYFFSTEGEWLLLDVPIPMENVIIEFDGYTERNGFTVAWSNEEDESNSATIGGWFNSKSVLKTADIENAVYKEGSVWRPRTWHTYRVVRAGSQFIVYCDDRIAISRIEPPHIEGTGTLRFSSWDSRLGLDNVRIYATDPGAGPQAAAHSASQAGAATATTADSPIDSLVVHFGAGEVPPEVSVETVPASVERIQVLFAYDGLSAGDLLFGRLVDTGRGRMVREMPIVVMASEGSDSFALPRGMTPWLPGRYKVEIVRGDEVLAETTFGIVE